MSILFFLYIFSIVHNCYLGRAILEHIRESGCLNAHSVRNLSSGDQTCIAIRKRCTQTNGAKVKNKKQSVDDFIVRMVWYITNKYEILFKSNKIRFVFLSWRKFFKWKTSSTVAQNQTYHILLPNFIQSLSKH